jgi:formate transporter
VQPEHVEAVLVARGFEHSVANMYLIPRGLFIKKWGIATLPSGLSATIPDLGSLTWANFAWSLVPVTLGTLIGGAGLAGAV